MFLSLSHSRKSYYKLHCQLRCARKATVHFYAISCCGRERTERQGETLGDDQRHELRHREWEFNHFQIIIESCEAFILLNLNRHRRQRSEREEEAPVNELIIFDFTFIQSHRRHIVAMLGNPTSSHSVGAHFNEQGGSLKQKKRKSFSAPRS